MTNSITNIKKYCSTNRAIFALLWVVTFLLYIPAAKAGWVIDAAGWLYHVSREPFWVYLNRTTSHIASLYQFTQFTTYLFYQIWGANVWAWSLLYITLHAINAWLLYIITLQIFNDSNLNPKQSKRIVLAGVLLFTICPHISEVLIWKACYHYLQGFLLLLLSVYWLLKYQATQNTKLAIYSALVFLCSAFALEVFYLTPFFMLVIAWYYGYVLSYNKTIFRKSVVYFVLPQIAILIEYVFLFHYVYKDQQPHVYNLFSQSIVEYLSKLPKYLFHIAFLGRYFPFPIRQQVYAVCNTIGALVLFYGLSIVLLVVFIARFNKISNNIKLFFLLFLFCSLTIAILLPLPFPNIPLRVFYDRYTYFSSGFVYLIIAFLVFKITNQYIAYITLGLYGILNLYFTYQLNRDWKQSAYIDNRLFTELPNLGNKTVLLLNIPENMNGIPMIGAQPDGEYKMLRDFFVDTLLKNPIYDVLSYNLTNMHNSVNVVIINDSILNVSFNQPGNWWWYEGHGASNYETQDYKVNINTTTNDFTLTLKQPKEKYLVLYEVDGMWQKVNW